MTESIQILVIVTVTTIIPSLVNYQSTRLLIVFVKMGFMENSVMMIVLLMILVILITILRIPQVKTTADVETMVSARLTLQVKSSSLKNVFAKMVLPGNTVKK